MFIHAKPSQARLITYSSEHQYHAYLRNWWKSDGLGKYVPTGIVAFLASTIIRAMENFLRNWRQDALNKHQYESAIFIGDKLLALTSKEAL